MSGVNVELARSNMITNQIRPWDVLDQKVLDAVLTTPREKFTPAAYANLAFVDMEIPIGHGQRMMAPKLEAKLLQALEIKPGDIALEIGTGSGYLTALLAKLALHVYSLDKEGEFSESARAKLSAIGISNATLGTKDGTEGWEGHGPYDVIAVTGSLSEVSDSLLNQLRVGGRLFVVLGEGIVMHATLITRRGESEWQRERLFETVLAPLEGTEAKKPFTL